LLGVQTIIGEPSCWAWPMFSLRSSTLVDASLRLGLAFVQGRGTNKQEAELFFYKTTGEGSLKDGNLQAVKSGEKVAAVVVLLILIEFVQFARTKFARI